VVLDAPQAAGGVAVAEGVYGASRPDVAQAYGAAMANSGFTVTFRAAGSPGNKTFWVYVHSTANDGWTNKTLTLRYVTAAAPPAAAAPAPAPAPAPSYNQQDNRPRSSSGVYCDQYTSNQYGYGNQYGGYGSPYGNQQYCDYGSGSGYYGGYGSGYYGGGYGSGYYGGGYGSGYYGSGYGYPYGGYGSVYGSANNCANSASGFNTQYYNVFTGQYYSTYQQCIAAGGTGYGTGAGNCILSGSYYYNSLTGQYFTTYQQCISTATGGAGNCVLYQNVYYNTTTGQYYTSYEQCILAAGSGGTTGATVTGIAAADGTVTLTWTPISTATFYRVYNVSTNSVVATVSQSSGSVSISTTLTGLTPGSSQTYQVRAVNSIGQETVVTATQTNTGAVVVAPATNLAAGTRTQNTIALTWNPSVTGSVSSYQVQQSLTGAAGSFVNSNVTNISGNGATVTGLTANTTYYFQVIAFVGTNASAASNQVVTSTLP
jgi:hypothetical protein